MGSDFTINVPDGVEWSHGVPFRDWPHAERAARGWSLKEFATRLKDATGEMSGGRPGVTPIETLIRRWEGGRTAISRPWPLVELARAWPDAGLVVVDDSGHLGSDTMSRRQRRALDTFARR